MKQKLLKYITSPHCIFIAYCAMAIIATLVQILKPGIWMGNYTHFNNYVIFKTSFQHLVSGGDLYTTWPQDHFDYYKYSPAFALFMAPFSWMNTYVGLFIWNLLNALVLFFAIRNLPLENEKTKAYILLFIFLELLTSIQNSQSNGLMAGLIIAAFNGMEKGKYFQAALVLTLGVYIKIFSLVAFLLLLLYPSRIKSIAYAFLCTIVFASLPLLVVSPHHLMELYNSWLNLLQNDHSVSLGLSVMGWLQSWFGIFADKMILVITGALLLMLPLVRIAQYKNPLFRIFFLASVLIWVIIFNHKAESPTFVIAMAGIAIWYFSGDKNTLDTILVCIAFVFTSLSPTDIFPHYVREHFMMPYVLKAVPCIIIWGRILQQQLFSKFTPALTS